jgi:hypothetical protein
MTLPSISHIAGDRLQETLNGRTTNFTKVVALTLQFLDKEPADEPMLIVEEEAVDYEA